MNLNDMELGVWTGLIWLSIGLLADSCEHNTESSSSIKVIEFLD
jgi:hypothetical protein